MKTNCNLKPVILVTFVTLSALFLSPKNGLAQDVRQTEDKMLKQAGENIE